MSLHPADLDKDTRYELGKLRIQTDRAVNTLYRKHGISVATALDPEVIYLLDLLDALIEISDPEECLA